MFKLFFFISLYQKNAFYSITYKIQITQSTGIQQLVSSLRTKVMGRLVGCHRASLIMLVLETLLTNILLYKLLIFVGQYDPMKELCNKIKIELHLKIIFCSSEISSFIHLLIHPLIENLSVEYLIYARLHKKCWD